MDVVEAQKGGKPGRRVAGVSAPPPASRGVPAEELAQPLALLDGVLADVERFFGWTDVNYAALEHAVARLRDATRWLHQLAGDARRDA